MKLSLSPEVQKLIDDRVRSGKYETPEDVVTAALATLEQQEREGDFAPGELDALLDQGERSGTALDGETVLAELRELRRRNTPHPG